MRDSNWHGEIQAQYQGYTIAQLEWVRDDAGAAAKVATGIKQNDYLDMALYASQELKRRENLT
tara:strand:- start:498 stop:686 length:189 start_codon:yes stop_codon:yes gene_type:complete